jgi:hypothetical protein
VKSKGPRGLGRLQRCTQGALTHQKGFESGGTVTMYHQILRMPSHLSHGASGALRRCWMARPMLEGIDCWEGCVSRPPRWRSESQSSPNVRELDEQGEPVNEKHAERRAAAWLYRYCTALPGGNRTSSRGNANVLTVECDVIRMRQALPNTPPSVHCSVGLSGEGEVVHAGDAEAWHGGLRHLWVGQSRRIFQVLALRPNRQCVALNYTN